MNAEIYFPREGRSFGQTSENGFDETVKKLNDINVNIIYKTEVNLNQKSISEALKVSESGDEKIGLIMIADVLSEDSSEKAKEFFESIGILGKIQRIEAEYKDPDDTDTEKQNSSKSPAKKNKKSRKNKNADTEPIDITQSIITIENRPVYAYAVEYNNKLLVILPKFDVLNISFTTELYSVATAVANPSSKEAFWKRFIPCAGDRPLDVVRKIILILAICTVRPKKLSPVCYIMPRDISFRKPSPPSISESIRTWLIPFGDTRKFFTSGIIQILIIVLPIRVFSESKDIALSCWIQHIN